MNRRELKANLAKAENNIDKRDNNYKLNAINSNFELSNKKRTHGKNYISHGENIVYLDSNYVKLSSIGKTKLSNESFHGDNENNLAIIRYFQVYVKINTSKEANSLSKLNLKGKKKRKYFSIFHKNTFQKINNSNINDENIINNSFNKQKNQYFEIFFVEKIKGLNLKSKLKSKISNKSGDKSKISTLLLSKKDSEHFCSYPNDKNNIGNFNHINKRDKMDYLTIDHDNIRRIKSGYNSNDVRKDNIRHYSIKRSYSNKIANLLNYNKIINSSKNDFDKNKNFTSTINNENSNLNKNFNDSGILRSPHINNLSCIKFVTNSPKNHFNNNNLNNFKKFSKMAHEFKTPLNVIIGLITELKILIDKNKIFNTNSMKEDLKFGENNYFSYNNENKKNHKTNSKLNTYKNSKEDYLNNAFTIENNAFTSFITRRNSIFNSVKDSKDHIGKIVEENLSIMNSLSNYLIFLITDITQFISFSNSTNLIIIPENISIKPILDFCYDIMKSLLACKNAKKNVKCLLEYDNNIDKNEVTIISNEMRIKQILLNFISNAVKFTNSGSIVLKSKINLKKSQIKISVTDTGMGIREEDQRGLFKDFQMIEESVNGHINPYGSGLGLSICKYIADKLSHQIKFKSSYGKGSTFSIIINYLLKDLCDKTIKFTLNDIDSFNSKIRNSHQANESSFITNSANIKIKNEKDIRNIKKKSYVHSDITYKRSGGMNNNNNDYIKKYAIHKKSSISLGDELKEKLQRRATSHKLLKYNQENQLMKKSKNSIFYNKAKESNHRASNKIINDNPFNFSRVNNTNSTFNFPNGIIKHNKKNKFKDEENLISNDFKNNKSSSSINNNISSINISPNKIDYQVVEKNNNSSINEIDNDSEMIRGCTYVKGLENDADTVNLKNSTLIFKYICSSRSIDKSASLLYTKSNNLSNIITSIKSKSFQKKNSLNEKFKFENSPISDKNKNNESNIFESKIVCAKKFDNLQDKSLSKLS